MALSIKRQRHIRKILVASVGPRLGGDLYSTLTKWEYSCGPEWTVSRLKALNTVAKQLRAGNFDVAQAICNEVGISHSNGVPKGHFGDVIQRILFAKRPPVLRRLFAVLRVYTCILLDGVSDAQYRKHLDSIGKSPEYDPFIDRIGLRPLVWEESLLERALRSLSIPRKLRLNKPDLSRLKSFSSYHRKVGHGNSPWVKAVGSLISCTYIPESLKDYNPCEDVRSALTSAGADASTCGHIAFLQEGGCKARVVAVPNVWCQWLFEPLHRSLNSLIKGLPCSAVHDQNRGGYFLQSHIGSPMWCFDLSSATDRYPRNLQMQVLEAIGLHHYAQALDEISSGNWELPNGEHISYAVGQPMGLYGSFPLFHLSHTLQLEIEWLTCPGYNSETPRPYMVLGDDVIITDPDLANRYRQDMELLDVEVSPTKSIISDKVGEFGGFLCLQTNKGSTVFRPYKYKETGFKNPVSLLHSLGANVRYLGPYWAKIYSIFARTLEGRYPDLSPIVTEDSEAWKRHNLDSYYLGSLVTKLSYETDFVFPDISMNVWSRAFQDFLGNKEVTTTGSYAAPLRVQSGASLALPEYQEEKYLSPSSRINTDPLIRALRYAD